MNSDQQQKCLPGVRDWREPQSVRFGELGEIVLQSVADGYQAIRLDVVAGGYVVTFQKVPTFQNKQEPPQLARRRSFATFAEKSQPKDE
jgi:hypothetical protein